MEALRQQPAPLRWGAPSARRRGPIIRQGAHKNVLGGSQYAVWAALAQSRATKPLRKPDFRGHGQAWQPVVADERIVSFDPWGECVHLYDGLQQSYDLRPSIASCEAWLQVPELEHAIERGELEVDGHIVCPHRDKSVNQPTQSSFFYQHQIKVWQISIDPVWYLPGVAKRLQVDEGRLRRALCDYTGVRDLVERPEEKIFLPPTGGTSVYVLGRREALSKGPVCLRIHDECNSSDVFGSDVCTCRPYLMYSLQRAVRVAQQGGVGVILYCRKEGRGFGEVPKFWACHMRHAWQQQAGKEQLDTQVQQFIEANLNVAGVHDLRFHELVPDVLHWLGISKVHELLSMNTNKHQALINQGIEVQKCVPIDDKLISQKARVEVEAKNHREKDFYDANDDTFNT